MGDYTKYFPSTIFQDMNGPCPVRGVTVIQVASTTATIVSSVSDKSIRIISMHVYNDAAGAGLITLLSSTIEIMRIFAPGSTLGVQANFEFNPAGWCETIPGDSLRLTTPAGANFHVNIRYITFTP